MRTLLTLALTLTASFVGVASANAVPGAPTITSITNSPGTSTIDVTVTFTRAAVSPAAAGYIYSTNGGTTWAQCNSSNCTWTTGASTIVIQKLSNNTPSMQYGDSYQIVIAECSSGSATQSRELAANISALGLQSCGAFSSTIAYTGGTPVTVASAPTISTTSTIANAANGASIVVTGNDFKSGVATSDFTIGTGTTGLTSGSLTFTDSTTVSIAFTGTAKIGDLTIQAKTSAYTTAPSGASNTLTISVPNAVPPAPGTPSGTVASSAQINLTWTAPSNNTGSAVTDYLVYYSSNSGSTWETFTASVSTSTSRNITGLTAATSYIFKVAAKNSVGYGPFSSNSSSYTTLSGPQVPETPTAVSAGSATTSSLSVSWTAPSNDGGAAISSYWLQKSSDNGVTWETVTVSASSPQTVSGLTISTSYVFRVAARNSIGYGPFSAASTAVSTSANTPAPAPEIIYAPTITSLSKLKVCSRGQDEFIIRGSGFKNASVTIDGVPVTIKGNADSIINLSFGETTPGVKTIKVTNSAGTATAEVEFKLVDKTAFKVFDIPYIYKGGSFYYQFEAFGENTFRITGNLPAGLVLNAETGEISGIPTEEGFFNFVLHADGLCGNDVDVIKLDIDKEIPNAISHRIRFSNPKSKKITGTAQFELKKFLQEIKKISPKQIEPVIYITGGAPENEAEVESQSAKERRDSLCDIMLTNDILAQTVLGLFSGGDEDEIEIFVYWPVVR